MGDVLGTELAGDRVTQLDLVWGHGALAPRRNGPLSCRLVPRVLVSPWPGAHPSPGRETNRQERLPELPPVPTDHHDNCWAPTIGAGRTPAALHIL